ncbi:V-set domain-containing T-cell activation inhibitor 1 isoform X1 [Takifugu flavidus]|uniref:V-set domain-containing T-cell activation inhibitor 1 n=1 Tax=Takifugu flavidus TaxID=433684 RepID=A0A5C6PNW7_9TELE|nr:V-set domain-containing T-cell activation inhibitor 1 isoform X1 [Takifugu flavidus]TWW80438.1 V-set domain-containing T-cell activation inhibitor 1 [Takifugu flavidus]
MASLGQIIFCSMITIIILFSTIIILILSLTFSHNAPSVVTQNTFPVANLGQDHLLSCQIVDTEETTYTRVSVTWEKTGMKGFVYRYLYGGPYLEDQNPQFEERTEVFPDALLRGNASLLLRSVSAEDEGVYTCTIDSPTGGGKVNIRLRTAAYTAPTFTFSKGTMTAVADRWFPRPNVTWMDHNRKVLQATTSIQENSVGIFSVVSNLPQVTDRETYTLEIQNKLVTSISRVQLTDLNVSTSSYFSFSRAPPTLASVVPSIVAAVACVYLLI